MHQNNYVDHLILLWIMWLLGPKLNHKHLAINIALYKIVNLEQLPVGCKFIYDKTLLLHLLCNLVTSDQVYEAQGRNLGMNIDEH